MELLISIKYSYSCYVKVQAGALDIGWYYLKCIRFGPMGYDMGEDKIQRDTLYLLVICKYIIILTIF